VDIIIPIITLLALVLGLAVLFALLRLFSIDATLKDIRSELLRHRPTPTPSPADYAEHACPKCRSGPTEIYERSREGEGWICRACNHTWMVSA